MQLLEGSLARRPDDEVDLHQVDSSPADGGADHACIERHAVGVFRFARSLGAARELAEDLTQEAFVVAWQKQRQQLPDQALASFLRRTVRLLWLEHRRRDRRAEAAITEHSLRLWEHEVAVDDDGSARIADARACVERLQGRAARAIALAYRDGRSRVEIAAELGMQPNGVRTLLARTRSWLEQCIRRQR
ncbi:MAG: sigma-70 family RNA polymerase sigma factor [Planctomycetes bacterium]|nr:sigma-70 family RNA polymerase sigma factor [Planctomycetota bacterium]